MVNTKTEMPNSKVVYKQYGKPSKSTACNAHSKEPQTFLARLHPMHSAQLCSPYTNHTEWEFSQEVDTKALDRPIDPHGLWVLAGSFSPALGSVPHRKGRQKKKEETDVHIHPKTLEREKKEKIFLKFIY